MKNMLEQLRSKESKSAPNDIPIILSENENNDEINEIDEEETGQEL